jgi:hypothetical protein
MSKEDTSVITLTDGEAGVTLSTLYRYFYTPCDMTILYVTTSPSADDASLTVDINDDGTGVITAVDCSDVDVPGTWKSTAMSGTNAPVVIAAGSLVSLDANSSSAGTRIMVQIWFQAGTVWA